MDKQEAVTGGPLYTVVLRRLQSEGLPVKFDPIGTTPFAFDIPDEKNPADIQLDRVESDRLRPIGYRLHVKRQQVRLHEDLTLPQGDALRDAAQDSARRYVLAAFAGREETPPSPPPDPGPRLARPMGVLRL